MLLAQNLDQIQSRGLPTFVGGRTVGELINNSKILNYVFAAAGIGLLIYIVMAGLQMMTSRGDPKAMQAAQSKITTALIGFVVIFLAYSFVKLVGVVFGITVFGNIFR